VCVSFPNGGLSTVGEPVKVTATVKYHWLPFLGEHLGGVLGTTVTGSSIMRIEAAPTNYSAGCS
jgi:hypothetical protein